MIAFVISLLWFLFYAALVYLALLALFYFYGQIFGPVSPRAKQIIYAMVGILMVIWFLSTMVTSSPIPPPWGWTQTRQLR